MEVEVAYDWGRYHEQPGSSPNDTLGNPEHRNWLINVICELHCSGLGWVANYDASDAKVRAGAEDVQKAFGYRFVIDEVRYPAELQPDKKFTVTFAVRNTGSAPFYYNWPVELNLLAHDTKLTVWKRKFENVDIRKWLPGDKWNVNKQAYDVAPQAYRVSGTFDLAVEVGPGHYILALAILDPAGMKPAVRFAIENYFTGGYHPIGMVGVGEMSSNPGLSADDFDNTAWDRTLRYELR
jgi:hypothetical protein